MVFNSKEFKMKSKNTNKLIAILNKNSSNSLNNVTFYDSHDRNNTSYVTINNINSKLNLFTDTLTLSGTTPDSTSSLINISNELNSKIIGSADTSKLSVENHSNSRFFIKKDSKNNTNLPVSFCNFQRNGNIFINCTENFNKCLIDDAYINSLEQQISDLNWYSIYIDYNNAKVENVFNGYVTFDNNKSGNMFSNLSVIDSISNVDCKIVITPSVDLSIKNISFANLVINPDYTAKTRTLKFENINNVYLTGYRFEQELKTINCLSGTNSIIHKINLKNSSRSRFK
jgi:hypothetical protein